MRPDLAKKMEHGLYRKSAAEWGPTFEDKVRMVEWMAYRSNISAATKARLTDEWKILEDWETRGIKYAVGFGFLFFFFCPVVR